ncbi:MAG: rane protein [Gemmatimonadetes bacterium]|nr:rane protein [Gemmatimonadota bacterium]
MRTFREIFRFECAYQLRRPATWLYAALLLGMTILFAGKVSIPKARAVGFYFNSSIITAEVTLIGSLLSLLVAAALAGSAGARDVQTRMDPLLHTTRLTKTAYLGGRFLAVFVMTALVQLAVPCGLLIVTLLSGLEPALSGPFRPTIYLSAYWMLAVPNAFAASALMFSVTVLSRRAIASLLGALFLCFTAVLSWQLLAATLGRWTLAECLDPMGLTVLSELARRWTPAEKGALIVGLQPILVLNRLLWLCASGVLLVVTTLRFRFAHSTGTASARRSPHPRPLTPLAREAPIRVPSVVRTFGFTTRFRQLVSISWASCRSILRGPPALLVVLPGVIFVLSGESLMQHLGTRLVPTTGLVTSILVNPADVYLWIAPLFLVVLYAGELVWRERDIGMSQLGDAAPVPEWINFSGRLCGLCLVLMALQLAMTVAGIVQQLMMGYHHVELGLYVRILFGLQLSRYVLFAMLAIVVHIVVNEKYVAHVVVILAYLATVFAPSVGVEHHMLVYGSAPGWTYSDMEGFGTSLRPVLSFMAYWSAWALLFAVVGALLWVRGPDDSLRARLKGARRRLSRTAAATAMTSVALVLAMGGFVFYNTNVLHAYQSTSDVLQAGADYERRYARFADLPQPHLDQVALDVEIFPDRPSARLRGIYHLVNRSSASIDSLHFVPSADVETSGVTFDRPAQLVLADSVLRYRIYALATPLQPGDSLQLGFTLRFVPRGFSNDGATSAASYNGTYISSEQLPIIGYARDRELSGEGERRIHGLGPRRPESAGLWIDGMGTSGRVSVSTVIATQSGQVAVAPGSLRRSYVRGTRRYFEYATAAPIRNDYAIYSAAYAVSEGEWRDSTSLGRAPVRIQVLYHPGHGRNVARAMASVRSSLDYMSREFGPYPHSEIRLIERPGDGIVLHSAPINIWFQEGFSLLAPRSDSSALDQVFAVVAHEVAHQWWGNTVTPAAIKGQALLTESLAWYSALNIVERERGSDELARLLAVMREAYLTPQSRAAPPLLQASSYSSVYRKGLFAMFALREYLGAERVNMALRRLVATYGDGRHPLATSQDLYRELLAVAPDSLRPLVADLFATNTYWELAATRAVAEPAENGQWRVTLDVTARKFVVDSSGAEVVQPMDDLVEVGISADSGSDSKPATLYRRAHRVGAGRQQFVITVPRKPSRAGIDPRSILIDVTSADNMIDVTFPSVIAARRSGGGRR